MFIPFNNSNPRPTNYVGLRLATKRLIKKNDVRVLLAAPFGGEGRLVESLFTINVKLGDEYEYS